MPLRDLQTISATRRLDRVMRRQRFRSVLNFSGILLLIIGVLLLLYAFVPPATDVNTGFTKVDPHAGFALIRALPSGTRPLIGLAITLLGAALLVLSALIGRWEGTK